MEVERFLGLVDNKRRNLSLWIKSILFLLNKDGLLALLFHDQPFHISTSIVMTLCHALKCAVGTIIRKG